MADSSDPLERTQPPHVQKWRKVLNHHWPAHPMAFETHYPGTPVIVRVVWEEYGEEFIEGLAKRWDAGHVYVEIKDVRNITNGVWVKPCDVYRSAPDEPEGDA